MGKMRFRELKRRAWDSDAVYAVQGSPLVVMGSGAYGGRSMTAKPALLAGPLSSVGSKLTRLLKWWYIPLTFPEGPVCSREAASVQRT